MMGIGVSHADLIAPRAVSERIASRVAEHHAAGADQVLLSPVSVEPGATAPALALLEAMAPAG